MIIAVDGGNSKTDLALVAEDGSLIAHARGPRSSPHHIGLDGCLDVLQDLVDASGLDGRRASIAQIMLAGVDFPEEEDAARAAFETRGWAGSIRVGNDTFAVLRAGTERGWGIALTCGAGMNCVGVSPDGRHVRFPALGDLTGDWGGGYDLGREALWFAARSEDGRGAKTVLEYLVPGHFGLSTPLELARAIHEDRVEKHRLVELAPTVMRAAGEDEVAAALLDRLVAEIVVMVKAAARRLGLVETEVVVGGGLMRAADGGLLSRIAAGLGPGLTLRRTSQAPIVGAALLGLDSIGAATDAQQRLRVDLDNAIRQLEGAMT
ncbi:MAG TPA: BadF/BadG/BcrA/BcrD ATPase family protein [Gaiellaceae bacterium]|nr:BadF/BadG/BcrA/BcrD ATPase family protein [Gaiellaceae bacterium]